MGYIHEDDIKYKFLQGYYKTIIEIPGDENSTHYDKATIVKSLSVTVMLIIPTMIQQDKLKYFN